MLARFFDRKDGFPRGVYDVPPTSLASPEALPEWFATSGLWFSQPDSAVTLVNGEFTITDSRHGREIGLQFPAADDLDEYVKDYIDGIRNSGADRRRAAAVLVREAGWSYDDADRAVSETASEETWSVARKLADENTPRCSGGPGYPYPRWHSRGCTRMTQGLAKLIEPLEAAARRAACGGRTVGECCDRGECDCGLAEALNRPAAATL